MVCLFNLCHEREPVCSLGSFEGGSCTQENLTACQQLLQHGAMQDVTDSVSGVSPWAVAAFCRSDLVMDIFLNVDFWIVAFGTTQ